MSIQRSPEKVRNVYHENREWAIARLGGQCVTCGSANDLEFDHIDPSTKDRKMSSLFHHSRFSFVKELRKCQLLCNPCHVEKSRQEKRKV